jgi:hypothetical protein
VKSRGKITNEVDARGGSATAGIQSFLPTGNAAMHAFIVLLTWPDTADVRQYFATLHWTEVKHLYSVGEKLFTTFVYFLGAVAALGVLWRLPKIVELVREFQKNSGPIWDLRNTVNDLKVLIPAFESKVQALQTQIKDQIEGKLLELQDQVSAGQRYAADNLIQPQFDPPEATSDNDWETVKKAWTDARDKLETIIEDTDGRRTRKYAKLPRYDYSDVIETMLKDGLVNKSIADDAQYMNREFRSLRNRKRQITDAVKSDFAERKKRFDKEVRQFKAARMLPSVSIEVAEPPPPPKGNGTAATTSPLL